MSVIACGSGMPQLRDGLYDKMAGAENQALSPGLDFSLELGGSIELGSQPIHVDQARSASDADRYVWYRKRIGNTRITSYNGSTPLETWELDDTECVRGSFRSAMACAIPLQKFDRTWRLWYSITVG
jgi:hypothetical protein